MTAAIRSEALKLRSAPGPRTALVVGVGLSLLLCAFYCLSSDLRPDDQRDGVTNAALIVVFAGAAGCLLVAGELRHRTASATFTLTPTRRTVLGAKAVIGFLYGTLAGAVASAGCVAISIAVFAGRGVDRTLDAGQLVGLVVGTGVAAGLFLLVGMAFGALIGEQTGAVVAVVALVLLIEPAIGGLSPAAASFAPGRAATSVAGSDIDGDRLPTLAALLVLVAWAGLLGALGTARFERRDLA